MNHSYPVISNQSTFSQPIFQTSIIMLSSYIHLCNKNSRLFQCWMRYSIWVLVRPLVILSTVSLSPHKWMLGQKLEVEMSIGESEARTPLYFMESRTINNKTIKSCRCFCWAFRSYFPCSYHCGVAPPFKCLLWNKDKSSTFNTDWNIVTILLLYCLQKKKKSNTK